MVTYLMGLDQIQDGKAWTCQECMSHEMGCVNIRLLVGERLTKLRMFSGIGRLIRPVGTEIRSKHFEWQQSGILVNGRKPEPAMPQHDEGISRKVPILMVRMRR